MSRSKWKQKYSPHYLKKLVESQDIAYIHCRNATIESYCLGKQIYVHNGKTFILLNINENMLGYKFGEFIFTRSTYIHKKNKNKKKK